VVLTTPHRKKTNYVTKYHTMPWNQTDPSVRPKDGRIILKWIFERLDGGAWAGSICPRIGTGGGLL
jgi:hypothetical protein